MERTSQRIKMQTIYYDPVTEKQVSIPQDKPRFLDFDAEYGLAVTDEMSGLNSSYLQTWIDDVNDLKAGFYDDPPSLKYPFTHFTKLPYLYVELADTQHFKYPVIYSPRGHAINGGSRMLIQTQFFPKLQWDAIKFKFGGNPSYNLDLVVESILKNKYWQKNINSAPTVRALLEYEYVASDPEDFYYSLNDIGFIHPPVFAFAKDWMFSIDFIESVDYSILLEKISRTKKLWDNMRNTIKQYQTLTNQDYRDLLDIIVLDNVDFVKKWHSDFL